MSDLRTQLGDYFDSVVERVDVTDVVERSTTSIGPRPDFGVGRGAEPTPLVEAARPRLPVLLTAAAVAVLVVVAIVVLTSRSDSDTQIIDQPPTTVSLPSTVTSTTVAPEPFVGEVPTVDVSYPTELLGTALTPSPIGDFRWTLLSGDRAVLPNHIVKTPTGFASVNGLRLLESTDGSEWEAVAPPVPGLLTGLTVDEAGTYVLRTVPRLNTRLSVPWESTDFVNWTPVAASEPLSLRQLISGPGVLSGELTELVTTAEGAAFSEGKFWIDWGSVALLLGGDDLQRRIDEGLIFDGPRFDPGSGIVDFDLYENRDDRFAGTNPLPSGVQVSASISGTVDSWTVELENIEDGTTIGTVTGSIGGMPVDEVLETLAGGGVLSGFYLVSGDDVEPVEPPWFDAFATDDFRLFARIDDVLFAYIADQFATSSPMEVWRSPNGRTWESLGPTPFSTTPLPLRERDGVLVAQFENGRGEEYTYQRSVDGISWSPPTRPPETIFDSSSTALLAVDAGWILVDRHVPDPDRLTFEFDPRPSIWTSLDGDVWEQLDTSEWPREMPPELAELPVGIGSFLTRSSNEHAYSGISQTDPSTPTIVAIVEWN